MTHSQQLSPFLWKAGVIQAAQGKGSELGAPKAKAAWWGHSAGGQSAGRSLGLRAAAHGAGPRGR